MFQSKLDVYVHYLSKPNIYESRPPLFDCSFTTSSNYSGTSLIRSVVTNGPKKFGRINGVAVLTTGFFYKKMHGGFCQAAKKFGRNNEVAMRRGFTVLKVSLYGRQGKMAVRCVHFWHFKNQPTLIRKCKHMSL